MVKIIRGTHETKVTKGAYENIFKPLGYTLVEKKKKEMPRNSIKNDELGEAKNAEPIKNDEFKGKGKKQED